MSRRFAALKLRAGRPVGADLRRESESARKQNVQDTPAERRLKAAIYV